MVEIKVKYCGNHSAEDLQTTASGRAQYLGIVFAESKRQVTHAQLQQWLQQVPAARDKTLVGLFVNPETAVVNKVLENVSLNIIQLHGTESPQHAQDIVQSTKLPVWKAIHHDETALTRMRQYAGIVSGFVVDCKVPQQWGGTGKAFDWTAIPDYQQEAMRQQVPCFIAGGISDTNVTELLEYQPDGIDLSSGLEINGYKNLEKMACLEKRVLDAGFTIS